MEGSGRRSAASLVIAPLAPWTRLEPPESVTGDAADLWRSVVATKPADWFQPDTAPLLEAYCNTVVEYRRASRALEATSPADIGTYRVMVEIATKLAKACSSLATKMRLTPQARYTPGAAATASKKAAVAAKPWGV